MDQYQIKFAMDSWLKNILVDPISKSPWVDFTSDNITFENGLVFPVTNQIPDLRIKLSRGAQEWLEGQKSFEEWMVKYLDQGESDPQFYKNEKAYLPVYETMTLDGRVLDVGGQLGHIRHFMKADQEYCSIDPFINAHKLVVGRKNLFEAYPLSRPLHFIAGFAEFLPFKTATFDTVNMRSCLDHFYNPEIALFEAFRVLKDGGKLIIGTRLDGLDFKAEMIELVRPVFALFNKKYKDHHIWHPTEADLDALLASCGFKVTNKIWQLKDVLYIECRKQKKLMVQFE